MIKVITLVTNFLKNPLDEKIINKLFVKLEKKKAKIINLKWLSPDEACDVLIDSDLSVDEIRQVAVAALEDTLCDYFVQNNDNRLKKLLISDMDSTIINQECIDEIADKLNIKDKVSAITEIAMNGEIEFEESIRMRVNLLQGVTKDQLEEVLLNNITLTDGANTLVKTMNKFNAKTILVSGGFTFFTETISKMIGFGENFANVLEMKDNILTGKVKEPILSAKSKLEIMNDKTKQHNITNEDVIAVGDGANDLFMLEAASLGFAYYAKPAVIEKTKFHINNTNLEALLFAQGIKRKEFVK